ncbi:unnamed protein product [Cylindrotheca closterium]|uniref:Peptidase M11 gametolysin domain-containing protein n=1 Tax=Cylindrotheca closterium TaxID=2856 RepID=A0AAD2G3E9_9STRA|nr:unnamed protein product [Cylindrotheca closterium]
MRSEAFAAPSFPQKSLLCIFCLFWNLNLAQATINNLLTGLPSPETESPASASASASSPSPLIVTQTTASDSSADHLVPFDDECVAHVTHTIADNGSRTQLLCTVNGLSFLIPSIRESWIKEQMELGKLISDETVMTLPEDAMLNQYTDEIHTTEPPTLWNHEMEERERRRRLRRLATTGTKTVLVVRIQATDKTSALTATQIGNYVFGDDGSAYNLKAQTAACSFNTLTYNKASARNGATTSIANGIVTIPVSVATSVNQTKMTNAVTAALQTEFSVTKLQDLADHLMYCFPKGTMDDKTIANAFMGGFLSFYNDEACSYPSAQIHELGHNFNMGHSSDSAQEYGDKSGLMGFSYEYTDKPKMCFNAAKSWQLGWYASKADSITPSSSSPTYSTKLAGVVDFAITKNKVLIEIQQTSSPTFFYVNYNRATGINSGTVEGANSVLVVSKNTTIDTNVSFANATLSSGNSFAISNFNGKSGETLTITFTSLENNEANVDIVLTGFPETTPTASINPSLAPSKAPSMLPSRAPSTVPSNQPSAKIVTSVSIQPSSNPSGSEKPSSSLAPSMKPSMQPSRTPSLSPSNSPSLSPSLAPSMKPVPSPTASLQPSSQPSSQPSKVPTSTPVSGPTQTPKPISNPLGTPPSGPIAIQRVATIVVEVGIDGLNDLDLICNGLEGFLKAHIQAAFDTNAQTSIACTQQQTRRDLVVTSFLDYEKPILLTVSSSFADFRQAPRQYFFLDFLEDLVVSEAAVAELPQYVKDAMGSSVEGVHIRLVETDDKPLLILAFGEDAPTPNPSGSSPTSTVVSQTSASGRNAGYLVSFGLGVLGVCTLL